MNRMTAWRAKNPEKAARLRKRYAQTHSAQMVANVTRWRKKNPEKKRAQVALQRAVKKGLVIPQPCEVCGEKAEAHHPDYSKPLEVVWLCHLHHTSPLCIR